MSIDPLSTISVRLETFIGDILLSKATGFFYKRNERYYLVTNWHVFSGRSTLTGQPLHAFGGIPNRLELTLHGIDITRYFPNQELLLIQDDKPVWLQHKTDGQNIDIAVVAIDPSKIPRDSKIYAYGDLIDNDLIRFSAGNDVFVIGFPRGLGVLDIFPVWKRGSIASDPDLGLGEYNGFLVDTATREGMSGSPVYRRSWNIASMEDGGTVMSPGMHTRLVGIYSGRFGANDELLSQLGLVWSIDHLNEIIDNPGAGGYEIRS